MLGKYTIHYLLLLSFMCCSNSFADEDVNTSAASGGDQIIVSPTDTLLDIGDTVSVNVLVLDEDGGSIEGRKVRIIPQDKQRVSVSTSHTISDESGYASFSILGKQQGDTVISVTDGVVSTHINVAIRDLIHYVLPYFYGDMQMNLINPTDDVNYVKIQFHENSDRLIPPVVVNLESKEMKTLKLSAELDMALQEGWAESYSTAVIFGGVWTNKGYLPFMKIDE